MMCADRLATATPAARLHQAGLLRAAQAVPQEAAAAAANDKYVPQLFGLDCEMCQTCQGLELCRITIVDECHKVLLGKRWPNDVNFVTGINGADIDCCTMAAAVPGA